MRVCSVIQLCLTLCNPMDYSLQASLLMEFSLPQPGFELASLVSPANKGPSSQGYGFSNSRVWM